MPEISKTQVDFLDLSVEEVMNRRMELTRVPQESDVHGKVASMVVTTLKRNDSMPSIAEAEMMITDPKQWQIDYKNGKSFRIPTDSNPYSNTFTPTQNAAYWSTQIWLMGDGSLDSYSNMIRNDVYPQDHSFTKLNMISMVSNDIQNITIPGLS